MSILQDVDVDIVRVVSLIGTTLEAEFIGKGGEDTGKESWQTFAELVNMILNKTRVKGKLHFRELKDFVVKLLHQPEVVTIPIIDIDNGISKVDP